MTVIPTGYAQVNVMFDGNGYTRGAQTTFGVKNNATLTAGDLAGVVIGLWSTNVIPVQGADINFKECKVKLGPNSTGGEAVVSAGVPGSVVGNTLPPNVAVLSRKVTALGGRAHNGRLFVPGATESQTDGAGQLNNAALTAWGDALDGFFDDMATGDLPLYLLHHDATGPDILLAFSTQRLMATQKRRLRRAGGRRTPTP